jgi:TolA-binding protein
VVPLAAILIGSAAWASGVLPEVLQAAREPEPQERHEERSEERTVEIDVVVPTAPRPPASTSAPVAVAVDEVAPPVAPPEQRAVAPSARALAPAPAQPIVDPADDLYRAAHAAHFAQNDPALALQRWNAYLAQAPKGRFVPEALYNRALCLVRLGQHQAAVAALTPFAAGSHGAYRQREAQQLIEALGSR